MSEHLSSSPSFGAAVTLRRLRTGLAACLSVLRHRLRCHAQRRTLAEMDARRRSDISADPSAVWREARKWWWQA
jgi:hypothetical protein